MRVLSANLLASIKNVPKKSVYKIYRKTQNGWKVIENAKKTDVYQVIQQQTKPTNQDVNEQTENIVKDEIKAPNDEISQEQPNSRQNEMKIQMLSKSLYDQVFRNNEKTAVDQQKIKRYCVSFIRYLNFSEFSN